MKEINMTILENYQLKPYNTFGIDAKASFFSGIRENGDLETLTQTEIFKENPFIILGGGSNILFVKDFQGIIIQSKIKTIEIIAEDNEKVVVRVGSGLIWDDFVQWSVERNLGGAENLSDIPGCVGAAPVQNIGAYGTEAKDIINSVEAYNLKENKHVVFLNNDCHFGYRWSIFKESAYSDYFITHVTFCLNKNPVLNTSYGKIEEELNKLGEKSVKTIRQVITTIRRSKLPSTAELGSAGSFFKNPVVELETAESLLQIHPTMPHYSEKNRIKIPAAWLIEKSGLKGFRLGNTGTYPFQPLVIVNYGDATGSEIADFSEFIRQTVAKKFGIMLEPEVCFVG